MLHYFKRTIGREELPGKFTYPFCYQPHPLVAEAASEVRSIYGQQLSMQAQGKMMGVMVVEDGDNRIGYLAAYSGEMEDSEEFFVPPVVDYLSPGGYFKTHEAKITAINREIERLKALPERMDAERKLEKMSINAKIEVERAKAAYREAKEERKRMREEGRVSEEMEQRMIRESQHAKAEIKRLEERLKAEIEQVAKIVESYSEKEKELSAERKRKSEKLQGWLFERYSMLNGEGVARRMDLIFADAKRGVPPSGSGDCCAPRLLQYAYQNGLRPLAIGEFWMGRTPANALRVDGNFYPACMRRCKPILSYMLRGIEVEKNPLDSSEIGGMRVVYEDQWIVVVNKPGGLQSVPGREQTDSVCERLRKQYGNAELYPAHRLDQFTSGVLVVAKDKEILAALQRQFEGREVKKRYVGVIGKRPVKDSGVINLPIGYDVEDTCRRTVDYVNGKPSTTRYRVMEEREKGTLVEFMPETGRTHQIRIHCAHEDGLAAPIIGDSLYGEKGEKMYLCSYAIQFVHPVTSDNMSIQLAENEWFA